MNENVKTRALVLQAENKANDWNNGEKTLSYSLVNNVK